MVLGRSPGNYRHGSSLRPASDNGIVKQNLPCAIFASGFFAIHLLPSLQPSVPACDSRGHSMRSRCRLCRARPGGLKSEDSISDRTTKRSFTFLLCIDAVHSLRNFLGLPAPRAFALSRFVFGNSLSIFERAILLDQLKSALLEPTDASL